MSSIEYEFHVAPFQAERVRFLRRAKGLGINQTAVNPAWECKSYPKNILYFKTGDVTRQERLISLTYRLDPQRGSYDIRRL